MKKGHPANVLFLAFLVLSCAACAEKWGKPGGTAQEFYAMKSTCISRSAMRFPPLLREVQISDGHTDPIQTNCNRFKRSMHCTTTGGQYHPPVMMLVDDNSGFRDGDTRSCFFENGWAPESDAPANTPVFME